MADKVRLPWKPLEKHTSEKGEDNMYPFTSIDFTNKDVKERYEGVLGPLSLFAPFPHEDELEQDVSLSDGEESASQKVELERPVTPINDEVKAVPSTFNKLAKLVRRRISTKPEIQHLSIDEQKDLAAVIMGEVNGIWNDVKMQVNDPFLNAEQNKELQRRIHVHIVTVCEKLFLHYIQKAQILNKRGVFSGPANMSRLKAQLALDAHKFLNVLIIRRYILEDLRRGEIEDSDDYTPVRETPSLLNYKNLIAASRPKSKSKRHRYRTREEDLKDLKQNIPGLDMEKLQNIVADLPQNRSATDLRGRDVLTSQLTDGERDLKKTLEQLGREKIVLKKSSSVPHLDLGENLLEELGIEQDLYTSRSVTEMQFQPQTTQLSKEEADKLAAAKPQPGSRDYAADDLKRLVGRKEEDKEKEDEEEDLPPLLQALTRSGKHDCKKEWLEQQLRELEEREKKRREEENITLREPTHPQPATVSTKVSKQLAVRTSDIRVSERVCLFSTTLEKYATVYNDLIDEIEPHTVKNLDSNLFLGDEINEVYKEIMKTVPTQHLDMEDDPLVEAAADSVDLAAAMASSTLSKKPDERIINPNLARKSAGPPWGSQDIRDWAHTPAIPPKDIRGRPLLNPMIPRGEDIGLKEFYGDMADQYMSNEANEVNETMARSYASWLNWWKNTVNNADYLKYMSTQDSDYLGVVFHFYNSDDEYTEDEVGSATRNIRKTGKKEEEEVKKLEELRTQKTEFKDGFWNVNSVLLGGLGKDPDVEDETQSQIKSEVSQESGQTHRPIKSRALMVSRKSQRSAEMSDTISGVSSPVRSEKLSLRQTPRAPSHPETKTDSTSAKGRTGEKLKELTAQDRLERVWAQLQMKDSEKLDMAIKYSSEDYHPKLQEAIDEWEKATELILKREALMAKLENFERLASDPNRFFEKGVRGSSVVRLEEAKIRSSIYKKIDSVDNEVKKVLEFIRKEFQDNPTYQGRPYIDKLQWDKTEMLYWLQEERKHQALEYEKRLRPAAQLPLKSAHLDPISPLITPLVK